MRKQASTGNHMPQGAIMCFVFRILHSGAMGGGAIKKSRYRKKLKEEGMQGDASRQQESRSEYQQKWLMGGLAVMFVRR